MIESALYQEYYRGIYQLAADQNKKDRFETTKSGYRIATSIESGNIGEGANQIFDDPNDINKINSDIERQKVIDFWTQTLTTRTNTFGKDFRIVIQQRCSANDLSGYILDTDQGEWCRLILPFEYRKEISLPTKIGWQDPRTEDNEKLTERIPPNEIAIIKRQLGSAGWSSQYNQNPRPSEGEIFNSSDFRYYDSKDGRHYLPDGRVIEPQQCWKLTSCDLAISESSKADYSVAITADITDQGDIILVNIFRKRVNSRKLIETLVQLNAALQPTYLLMETVAFQQAIAEELADYGISIRGVKPSTDKVTRSIGLQVKLENHQVFFPKENTADLEEELCTFPKGKHDDLVDSLSYLAAEVSKRVRVNRMPEEETPNAVIEAQKQEREKEHWHAMLHGGREHGWNVF